MICVILFFLVVAVFPISQMSACSYLRATDSASGMVDLQQLISLQYCIVDNCAIKGNGEILDVIYRTDSLLVTASRGNQPLL